MGKSKRVTVGSKVFFVSFLLTNQETETGSRRSVSPFAHRSAVLKWLRGVLCQEGRFTATAEVLFSTSHDPSLPLSLKSVTNCLV